MDGVGCIAWPTLLPYLQATECQIAGVDCDTVAAGFALCDLHTVVPHYDMPSAVEAIVAFCVEHGVTAIVPWVQEGLPAWARYAEEDDALKVVISPLATVTTCADKWKTFQLFRDIGLPTPDTALNARYPLIKPRFGRGGGGIRRATPCPDIVLDDFISQQIASGDEFTVDFLCNSEGQLVYAVPRRRILVESGIVRVSQVFRHAAIEGHVLRLTRALRFLGPANIQGFLDGDSILFTEINCRMGGGISLSMHATENWFDLMLRPRAPHMPLPIKDGLSMTRVYRDIYR